MQMTRQRYRRVMRRRESRESLAAIALLWAPLILLLSAGAAVEALSAAQAPDYARVVTLIDSAEGAPSEGAWYRLARALGRGAGQYPQQVRGLRSRCEDYAWSQSGSVHVGGVLPGDNRSARAMVANGVSRRGRRGSPGACPDLRARLLEARADSYEALWQYLDRPSPDDLDTLPDALCQYARAALRAYPGSTASRGMAAWACIGETPHPAHDAEVLVTGLREAVSGMVRSLDASGDPGAYLTMHHWMDAGAYLDRAVALLESRWQP